MKRKLILFDWDDTLFSKVEYKKRLRNNLAKICEVSEEEIFKFEEKFFENLKRSDDFQIKKFVESFSEKFNKKIELKDFNSDNLKIYSGALFSETISVLEKLNDNFDLGIYSQGFVSLQKIKIRSSGVENFFKKEFVYIDRNKLRADFVSKLPDEAIIVDDKKEVMEKLKPLNRFKIIWINRNDDEPIEGVTTIHSLEELISLD
ncbi:MAG: HAD hydrolase-like protein [Candidatus Shapirobacteria bacterium]|nr:HAD hydrolase-like protein [Candidatus Shapirobacteria bacterium]